MADDGVSFQVGEWIRSVVGAKAHTCDTMDVCAVRNLLGDVHQAHCAPSWHATSTIFLGLKDRGSVCRIVQASRASTNARLWSIPGRR